MKSSVYSWRISRELKAELERTANARGARISELLETAVRRLLDQTAADDAAEQRRLHRAAAAHIGALDGFSGGITSEGARDVVRERVRRRHDR